MLNDPNIYENPELFDPDRWLRPGLDKTDKNVDPLEIAFGFGRRFVARRNHTYSLSHIRL